MDGHTLLMGFPIEDEKVREHLAKELTVALEEEYKRGYEDGERSRLSAFWKNHGGKFMFGLIAFVGGFAALMVYLLL